MGSDLSPEAHPRQSISTKSHSLKVGSKLPKVVPPSEKHEPLGVSKFEKDFHHGRSLKETKGW